MNGPSPRLARSLRFLSGALAVGLGVLASSSAAIAAPQKVHATKATNGKLAPPPAARKSATSRKPRGSQAAAAPEQVRGRKGDGASAKHRKKTQPKCTSAPVTIERPELHEKARIALTDCDGKARREAQVEVSSLARHRGTARPPGASFDGVDGEGSEVTKGVALLNHGLIERLERIAHHFPGKPIAIVSGYRPESDGSYHQRARALDIHVAGVSHVDLVAFCKTLDATGCGYYPNSSFVHVDVREKGKVSWVDLSGPGEKPRYVRSWPPKKSLSKLAEQPTEDQPHDDGSEVGPPEAEHGGGDDAFHE